MFNVVTVYAGTAFVILQVVAAVQGPLHLPEWFSTMVIVLLCIGFVMAVFFSWVYEITPTGIKITRPVRTAKQAEQSAPKTSTSWKVATYVSLLIIIGLVGWHFFPEIFRVKTINKLRTSGEKISIAVMQFHNQTNDSTLGFMQESIQDQLINYLGNFPDYLRVRQAENINELLTNEEVKSTAFSNPVERNVSKKLNTDIYVSGGFQKTPSGIRLNARLIDSKTGEVFKSFLKEGVSDEIILMTDTIANNLKNYLFITILERKNIEYKRITTTTSPEAYKNYILARKSRDNGDHESALKYCRQALESDSDFVEAERFLAIIYEGNNWAEGKKVCRKLERKKNSMTDLQKLYFEKVYQEYFGTPNGVIKVLRQIETLDQDNPVVCYNLGIRYGSLQLYEKAIPEYERALDIYNKWKVKQVAPKYYFMLGSACYKAGKMQKAKRIYRNVEKIYPENIATIYNYAVFEISQGNSKEAERLIEKYKSLRKEDSASESNIVYWIGRMYYDAGKPDEAEKYLRQAISMNPEATYFKSGLAFLLIDKELNLNEGMVMIDKLLEKSPDNYNFLYTKGLGLFKQGKFKEALELMEKSWKLRVEQAVYEHEAWLHLEAARKAVGEMK